MNKPSLSLTQIINMNVGFFGIQYSFGLQQSAVNPIYDMLGAQPDQIPLLNLAGPVTGLLIQPLIGAMSDKTWIPGLGRRKPFFFLGALICSVCLFLYPFSSTLWMAVGLLWILDVGNNTAMEPYRAFIADNLNTKQQPLGFQAQSFFTGFGQTLANVSLFVFPMFFLGKYGALPKWVYASFFFGSFISIASILWSMKTTKEYPPTANELAKMKDNSDTLFTPFIEIFNAIKDMPKVMWQLALVYLFQWYALFCYWQNSSKSIALSIFHATPADEALYEKAVGWAGLVNGWYNIVTFLVAFLLVGFAERRGAKWVHFVCLILAGLGFIFFPMITNKYLLFVAITGFGIGWASMMGIPYLLVVHQIPKARYGVYMGIINMMIVIPMILQTLTFGSILKNMLGNSAQNAILFAGALLLIAAFLTLRIKDTQPIEKN